MNNDNVYDDSDIDNNQNVNDGDDHDNSIGTKYTVQLLLGLLYNRTQ